MRNFISSLFTKAPPPKGSPATPAENSLKAAFQRSREDNNIDLVWPVLKAATLYVVVAEDRGSERLFLTKSPNPERLCVTVAEHLESLSNIQWPKKAMRGGDLVEALAHTHEIVVVYPDGGDYITQEHLAWYRQLG